MILPEKIKLFEIEKYILTVEISSETYSFSIHNPVEDESFFYHEIEKKAGEDVFSCFEDFYYENEFLTASFRKIFVINNSPNFTFVPANVFDEKEKNRFFRFNFSKTDDKVLIQNMRKPELTILHGISEKAFDFFNRVFINPQFVHHLSPLLSYFSKRTILGNTNKLIINLQKRGLDAISFTPSGDFIFANHFKYNHLNDAIYYIFFIWKQFNLNQLKDFIYIAGNSSQKQDLIKQMQKHIQNVFPVDITLSGVDMQNVPFEISSLALCEL